jgi:ATP-dependent exoDNAse (exonuclease V) beta subunit
MATVSASPSSPSQLTFPNIAIGASAGTGKTFQLSNRYLALINAGEAPDQVLAVTFTRKAAGEILDRILTRLAEAATSEDKWVELHRHIGGPTLDRNRCVHLLRTLLQHLHRLRISTLDSFFIQIAGSLAMELGLPAGWQIVDEIDDQRLRAEAMRDLLSEDALEELVTLIRSLSKQEVSRSVIDVLASIATSLYDLAQQTPREAWHALPRLPHLNGAALAGVIEQIAAFEFKDKRFTKANHDGIASAQDGDWSKLLTKGLAAQILAGKEMYYNKPIEAPVVAAYQQLIDHAQALLRDQIADQCEATRRVLDRFGKSYEQLKWQRRTLRFDDVTRAIPRALSRDRLDDITYRLDAPVTHLLLDEFQDTALPQWQAIAPFAETVSECPGQSFFCVGDVKQAIYGWRGGISELMEAVTSQLPNIGEERLNRSYRSSQIVIDTVNTVFEHLSENPVLHQASFRDATDAWRLRYEPHTTVHTDLTSYTCLATSRIASEGEAQTEVTLQHAAAEVATLHRALPHQTIGILVRRNRSVTRLIDDLRYIHGIAASEEGGNPLTDSVAVQLILSLLRLGDHPGDSVACFHVAHSPLGKMLGLERHDDKPAVLRVSLEVRQRLMSRGYGRTLYGWVSALAGHCDQNELNRLLQLVDLAYGYDPQATERTMDFVLYVAAKKVENPAAANVRVMTIHQSKGLQFDIVVLPELDVDIAGQLPDVVVDRPRPTEPITAVCRYVSQPLQHVLPPSFQEMFTAHTTQVVNESLCLLYVAMTRAIRALYLFIAPSKPNEKTLPKTFAGVLRGALCGMAQTRPEVVLYEHGAADWQNAVAIMAAPPSEATTETQTEFTIRLRNADGRRGRGLERLRPSDSRASSPMHIAAQLRPNMAQALRRGALLHAWLEQIEWLDDGEPNDTMLQQTAKHVATATLDIKAEIKTFRQMINMPQTRHVLSRHGYEDLGALGFSKDCLADLQHSQVTLQVIRERPFAIRDDDAVVYGIIDRLVLFRLQDRVLAADILDFKSGVLAVDETANIHHAVETYRPQLAMYRRAIARQFGLDLDRVKARLLLLQLGAISPTED